MKKRTSLIGLLALPLFHASAIDLTPRWTDTAIDSIPKRQLYFADGEKKFMLSVDQETEVSGRFGGASFRFPKFPDIDFIVMPSQFTPEIPFDETRLADYRKAARKLLPARANDADTTEENLDPIPINAWKSFRMMLHFKMDARTYVQTVTFLNLNERDQIVLVSSAPERDWSEAADRSWQILRSWQEMLPGDEVVVKGN